MYTWNVKCYYNNEAFCSAEATVPGTDMLDAMKNFKQFAEDMESDVKEVTQLIITREEVIRWTTVKL